MPPVINQQNNLEMSQDINPNTGKSDAQVYTESQNVLDSVTESRNVETPTPTPDPINRTVRNKPEATPDFFGDAMKEEGRNAQTQINSLNDYASQQMLALQPRQDERLRETSSINSLTGLGGSTEANVTTEKTTAINTKEDNLVRAEAEAQTQQILGNVSTKAATRAKAMREDFTFNAEQETARKTEDVNDVITLSRSGINAEAYKTADPEGYAYLAESLGGEEMLKASFVLNRPVEDILDSRVEGGKYVTAFRNPIDGKVRVESVDLGIPSALTAKADLGNKIMFYDPNDPTKQMFVNKGLTPSQAIVGGGGLPGVITGSIDRDAQSIMDGTLNLNDVSTAKNYRAQVSAELNKRVQEAKDSGDIYGVMKGSAAYDKEVSDTFLQSMEKTISVMQQLGVLQENIAGTDTGPLTGSFRGANPWDTNGQTIKAQLSAIVPNLARGVYGEVGVLTDNDIRTYSKTIPNLTSTEDVRNAVMYITIDMIRRNIETKITNQAAGQRDMSGYADIYKQVQDTATNILSNISGADITANIETGNTITAPDGTIIEIID